MLANSARLYRVRRRGNPAAALLSEIDEAHIMNSIVFWLRTVIPRSNKMNIAGLLPLLLTVPLSLVPGMSWAAETGSAITPFQDPLDHPAKSQSNLQDRPLMAITRAGSKLVAVGMRGLIVVSKDEGATWHQASVPVQSDLLGVMFPNRDNGWAVGHDGIILHSADGGEHWTVQLDGRKAEEQFMPYYEKLTAQGDARASAALESLKVNFRSGPSLPYLSVWFENDLNGYAVGSFGSIVATNDGGKSWLPWNEHIDNPEGLNLNGIYGVGGDLIIVGERGHVFKLDRAEQRFDSLQTGYEGSFFSVLGNGKVILAFGLRGKVYRSEDQGKTWVASVLPVTSTVASGAALDGDSGFVLVNASGELLNTDGEGKDVQVSPARKAMRLTAVVPSNRDNVVVTGLRGVGLETLPSLAAH